MNKIGIILFLSIIPLLFFSGGFVTYETYESLRVNALDFSSTLKFKSEANKTLPYLLMQDDATKGMLLDINQLAALSSRKISAYDSNKAILNTLKNGMNDPHVEELVNKIILLDENTLRSLDTSILELAIEDNAKAIEKYFQEYEPYRKKYEENINKLIDYVNKKAIIEERKLTKKNLKTVRLIVGSQLISVIAIIIAIVFLSNRLEKQQQKTFEAKKDAETAQDKYSETQNLYRQLMNSKSELEIAHSNLKVIFSSLDQAIFMLDDEGKITGEKSDNFIKILPSNPKDIQEFFNYVHLKEEKKSMAIEAVKSSIDEFDFQFETNSHLLPSKLEYRFGKFIRKLSVQWSPIVSRNITRSILVTIQDITSIEATKINMAMKDRKNAILLSLIENRNNRLLQTIKSLKNLSKRLELALKESNFITIKFIIHTIKGNARQIKLGLLSEICHEAETEINTRGELTATQKILNLLREYFILYKNLFHESTEDSLEKLLYDEIYPLLKENLPNHPLTKKLNKLIPHSLDSILSPVITESMNIADQSKLPHPAFNITSHIEQVPEPYRELLANVIGHLVRNSLAHGFEARTERANQNKTPFGNIYVSFSNNPTGYYIAYHDDGRGLDILSIIHKAQKQGISIDKLSREEIAYLIFSEDLSTSQSLNTTSGRGIGMCAVKEEVESSGGKVRLQLLSEIRQNFWAFEILIDLPPVALPEAV